MGVIALDEKVAGDNAEDVHQAGPKLLPCVARADTMAPERGWQREPLEGVREAAVSLLELVGTR